MRADLTKYNQLLYAEKSTVCRERKKERIYQSSKSNEAI